MIVPGHSVLFDRLEKQRRQCVSEDSGKALPQAKVAFSLRRDDSRNEADLDWHLKAPMDHAVIGDSAFFSEASFKFRGRNDPWHRRKNLWECSGLTELWNRRAATFFAFRDINVVTSSGSFEKQRALPKAPKRCQATALQILGVLRLDGALGSSRSDFSFGKIG